VAANYSRVYCGAGLWSNASCGPISGKNNPDLEKSTFWSNVSTKVARNDGDVSTEAAVNRNIYSARFPKDAVWSTFVVDEAHMLRNPLPVTEPPCLHDPTHILQTGIAAKPSKPSFAHSRPRSSHSRPRSSHNRPRSPTLTSDHHNTQIYVATRAIVMATSQPSQQLAQLSQRSKLRLSCS
jgi:hypothetical protein